MALDIGYDVAGLRRGSHENARAAGTGAAVARALAGVVIPIEVFGDIPAASGFHANAVFVRDRQAADARAEAARRIELARRAASTAGMAAGLTVETTAVARAAGR